MTNLSKAGAPTAPAFDVSGLVSNTTTAFVACCGIEQLQANSADAPLPLDGKTLSDSWPYLRAFITP